MEQKQQTKQKHQGSKWTPEQVEHKKDKICKLLLDDKKNMTVENACKEAGISFKAFYNWMKKDKKFTEKVRTSRGYIRNKVEGNILNQILEEEKKCGIREIYNKDGELINVITVRPESSWEWAKRRIPEMKDKQELSGEITVGTFADAVKRVREREAKESNAGDTKSNG